MEGVVEDTESEATNQRVGQRKPLQSTAYGGPRERGNDANG